MRVRVRVREAEAQEAYELLADGAVDLALSLAAQAPSAVDPRFTRVPLLADPLDVALPRDHPLARAGRAPAGVVAERARGSPPASPGGVGGHARGAALRPCGGGL